MNSSCVCLWVLSDATPILTFVEVDCGESKFIFSNGEFTIEARLKLEILDGEFVFEHGRLLLAVQ